MVRKTTYLLFLGIILIISSIISWTIFTRLSTFSLILFMVGTFIFIISYILEYKTLGCCNKIEDIKFSNVALQTAINR